MAHFTIPCLLHIITVKALDPHVGPTLVPANGWMLTRSKIKQDMAKFRAQLVSKSRQPLSVPHSWAWNQCSRWIKVPIASLSLALIWRHSFIRWATSVKTLLGMLGAGFSPTSLEVSCLGVKACNETSSTWWRVLEAIRHYVFKFAMGAITSATSHERSPISPIRIVRRCEVCPGRFSEVAEARASGVRPWM